MIEINWSDVINVVSSIAPQLIAIGVVLALAIVATVAVNRRTVADQATRKLIHAQSWLVFLVAAVVAVAMMVFGPLATLLNNATAERHMLSDKTIATANELGAEVQREGITLLKNDNGSLPLSDTNVNMFGWSSTNPVYGGTGSGSLSDTYPTVSRWPRGSPAPPPRTHGSPAGPCSWRNTMVTSPSSARTARAVSNPSSSPSATSITMRSNWVRNPSSSDRPSAYSLTSNAISWFRAYRSKHALNIRRLSASSSTNATDITSDISPPILSGGGTVVVNRPPR